MDNNIELILEDVEGIDLSLDVAVKKIYPPLENLEVTPTKEQQVFTHENSYGYDNVTVNPIPKEYIIPDGTLPITENATYDVRKFARVSAAVYPAPNLQDKEITINENGTHNIVADEEYDGLNQVSVTVDAIEDLSEELQTYNSELGTQNITITDIMSALKNKGTTGGGSFLGTPYKTGSDKIILTSDTSCSLTFGNPDELVLWFGYVRSDFTLSNNCNLLCVKDVTDHTNLTQKLVVGYTVGGATVTLNQASSGRMGLYCISFKNANIPQVIDNLEITDEVVGVPNRGITNVKLKTDNKYNLCLFTQIWSTDLTFEDFTISDFDKTERLGYALLTYATDNANIYVGSGDVFYATFVHIQIPALK